MKFITVRIGHDGDVPYTEVETDVELPEEIPASYDEFLEKFRPTFPNSDPVTEDIVRHFLRCFLSAGDVETTDLGEGVYQHTWTPNVVKLGTIRQEKMEV